MVVKNEDRFVWYGINSVLPYVDRFLITDTGSTDKTVEIIKAIKDEKIALTRKEKVTPALLTRYRQEQIDKTETAWLWLVDGDEVYPEKTAQKIRRIMSEGDKYDGIIAHRFDLLGDIYHRQRETVGSYNQFGLRGHYVLRCLRVKAFSDLNVLGDYPDEYFADGAVHVKKRGRDRFALVQEPLFHSMYLQRSTAGKKLQNVLNRQNYKIELGLAVNPENLPDIFFAIRPPIVPEVLGKISVIYLIAAALITPVKILKRKLMEIKI
ncbi:hypothetical protein A3B48_00180 [Candidatus Gottesmanbacteria bacterium RIFCSPLOWO2_01_FULL_40_10]|nr:MAG: hypothetical protein A3B48_00180 [Candidatus Gottesmanbacteria bacterium RIFCSPLOWO2_01_FULL_40_10]